MPQKVRRSEQGHHAPCAGLASLELQRLGASASHRSTQLIPHETVGNVGGACGPKAKHHGKRESTRPPAGTANTQDVMHGGVAKAEARESWRQARATSRKPEKSNETEAAQVPTLSARTPVREEIAGCRGLCVRVFRLSSQKWPRIATIVLLLALGALRQLLPRSYFARPTFAGRWILQASQP